MPSDQRSRWVAAASVLSATASHAPALAQTGLRLLALEYAATAVSQPLEVARILLQVQWSPRQTIAEQLSRGEHACLADGAAYRLILPPTLPEPPAPPQPQLASSSAPASLRLIPSDHVHGPHPSTTPEPENEELPSAEQPPNAETRRSQSSSQVGDSDVEPDTPDAGAILASVWAADHGEEDLAPRVTTNPQPPSTPSPELWPEAEADWASAADAARAEEERERQFISPPPPSVPDGDESDTELLAPPIDYPPPVPAPASKIDQDPLKPTNLIPELPFQRSAQSDHHDANPDQEESAFNVTGPKARARLYSYPDGTLENLYPHDTQDEAPLPIIYSGGLWDMIRVVCKGPEGWRALFKGTSLTFVLDALDAVPFVHRLLASVTGLPSVAAGLGLAIRGGGGGVVVAGAALALAPHPWQAWGAAVLSHAIVRMALVPLDTLRTRIVAQVTRQGQRKYAKPWGMVPGLRTMAEEEGGIPRLWLAPQIFWPALFDCTVRPSILLATPLLVDKLLPYDGAQPATTARVLLSLAFQTSALLVTLPIETIRRRLQVQPHFEIDHHARSIFVALQRPRRTGQPPTLPGIALSPDQPLDSTIRTIDLSSLPPAVNDLLPPASTLGPGTGYLIRLKGLRTCVTTRPVAYKGIMDTLSKIVREETSTPPWVPTSHYALMPTSGVYSLYRGFSIALMTLMAEAALALLLGESAQTGVWAEL